MGTAGGGTGDASRVNILAVVFRHSEVIGVRVDSDRLTSLRSFL